MNKFLAFSLAALSTVATVAPTVAHAQTRRQEFRDRRQEMRVEMGRLQGQISPREYYNLQRHQARIDQLQAQASADGVMTPAEQWQIERAQDMQSRRIERFRNNYEFRGARRYRY